MRDCVVVFHCEPFVGKEFEEILFSYCYTMFCKSQVSVPCCCLSVMNYLNMMLLQM